MKYLKKINALLNTEIKPSICMFIIALMISALAGILSLFIGAWSLLIFCIGLAFNGAGVYYSTKGK